MLTTDEANHYRYGLFIQNESFLRFFRKTTIIVNAVISNKTFALPAASGINALPRFESLRHRQGCYSVQKYGII